MADALLMHIVDPATDLLHDHRRPAFVEVSRFDDAVEEWATRAKLHDEVDTTEVFEDLIKLEDVRVVEFTHEVDLRRCFLPVHILLEDCLHGPHLFGDTMAPLGNGAKVSFTEVLAGNDIDVRYRSLSAAHKSGRTGAARLEGRALTHVIPFVAHGKKPITKLGELDSIIRVLIHGVEQQVHSLLILNVKGHQLAEPRPDFFPAQVWLAFLANALEDLNAPLAGGCIAHPA
mmetsp:Transcript_114810/g.245091  ORF Transcript_114810/g.245091 Transcript_114810/m.245091 type:complete len:231 (-) Transcript_114810:514-1206(-)